MRPSMLGRLKSLLRPIIKQVGDILFEGRNFGQAAQPERPIVYLGNNRALTRTVFGHKIIVDTRDTAISPHILLDGKWEPWITEAFLNIVKPGMNVVEVGANMGFYSLLAADRVGETGALTCFEANPEVAEILFHNLRFNGFGRRATVVNKAVFSETTSMKFQVFEKSQGGSGLVRCCFQDAHHFQKENLDSSNTIKVNATSLDDHFPKGAKVDLLKIDAEGADPHIIKGAQRLIQENPDITIIMEVGTGALEKACGSIENFYSQIDALGLGLYNIQHDATLKPVSPKELEAIIQAEEGQDVMTTDVVLKRRASVKKAA